MEAASIPGTPVVPALTMPSLAELDTTVVSTGVSAKAKAVDEVSVAAARVIELNDGAG